MFFLLLLIIALIVWIDFVPLMQDTEKDPNKNRSENTDDVNGGNNRRANNKGLNIKNNPHKKIIYVGAVFLSLSVIVTGVTYYELLEINTVGVYLNSVFKSIFPGFYEFMAI